MLRLGSVMPCPVFMRISCWSCSYRVDNNPVCAKPNCVFLLGWWSRSPNIFRFFAGGSERSGQQIVGPPKKKSSNEVVEDLFKGAREHGAVPLDRSGKGPVDSRKPHVWTFPDSFLHLTPWIFAWVWWLMLLLLFFLSRPSLVEATGLAQLQKSQRTWLERGGPPATSRMWVYPFLGLSDLQSSAVDHQTLQSHWSSSQFHISQCFLLWDFGNRRTLRLCVCVLGPRGAEALEDRFQSGQRWTQEL